MKSTEDRRFQHSVMDFPLTQMHYERYWDITELNWTVHVTKFHS